MEYNYIYLLKIFLATILIQATYCKVHHKFGVDKAFYLVKFSDEFKDSDSLVFYYQYKPAQLRDWRSVAGTTVNNEKHIMSRLHLVSGGSNSNWGQPADNDVLKSLYSKLIPDSNSYGPKSYVAYKMEKICSSDDTHKFYLLYKFHLKYFECESEARYFYQSLINYDKSNIAVRWSIKDNKFVESNGVFSTRVGSYPYYPDEVLMGNNTPDDCQQNPRDVK